MRGEVARVRSLRGARGHEQSGARFAVVVLSDVLPLSTWLVAPTSTSARPASFRPASFRPEVSVQGRATRVLAEQTAAVGPERLGEVAGMLTSEELQQVDAALRLVLSLSAHSLRSAGTTTWLPRLPWVTVCEWRSGGFGRFVTGCERIAGSGGGVRHQGDGLRHWLSR